MWFTVHRYRAISRDPPPAILPAPATWYSVKSVVVERSISTASSRRTLPVFSSVSELLKSISGWVLVVRWWENYSIGSLLERITWFVHSPPSFRDHRAPSYSRNRWELSCRRYSVTVRRLYLDYFTVRGAGRMSRHNRNRFGSDS